jgi:hypothetical protein
MICHLSLKPPHEFFQSDLKMLPDELRPSERRVHVRPWSAAEIGKCDVTLDCQVGVNTPVKGKPKPVGRCRFTVSEPVLKAPMVSTLETIMS